MVKHGLDWTSKTWTGQDWTRLVKRGLDSKGSD